MKLCFCRTILAILVIVLAWWAPTWSKYALTVLGALLVILSVTGVCCYRARLKAKAEPKKE
jgi:uncharacterized iron-regulated membrane protein